MKIVHVTRSLIVNSGISVFVAEMATAQAEQGHDVELAYTWRPDYKVGNKVKLVAFRSLAELEAWPDVVHIHGLWSMDMVRAMAWCRKNHVRYVVSPHGGLMPRVLRKNCLKKKIFYWLFLYRNLQNAAAIHCTGDGEVAAVKTLGIKTTTFVIPLGCHLPPWPVEHTGDGKTILFLSRLSEEKGLLLLLDAWGRMEHAGWRLVLAGPDWRGFRTVLERKIEQDQIRDVEFVGAVDARGKDVLYREAGLFILPSPVENFSMVVLDALSYGVPTICTRGTPWHIIEERKCGWWIEPNSDRAIEMAMNQAMHCREVALLQMSENAREIAKDFGWAGLAANLIRAYQKDFCK